MQGFFRGEGGDSLKRLTEVAFERSNFQITPVRQKKGEDDRVGLNRCVYVYISFPLLSRNTLLHFR